MIWPNATEQKHTILLSNSTILDCSGFQECVPFEEIVLLLECKLSWILVVFLVLSQIYDVRSLVQFEMVRLPKPMATLAAHVWLFPGVRALVSFQSVGTQKALLAVAARVRLSSRVVPQMYGQIARLSEAFPTVRTLERLVPRVEPFVLQ